MRFEPRMWVGRFDVNPCCIDALTAAMLERESLKSAPIVEQEIPREYPRVSLKRAYTQTKH